MIFTGKNIVNVIALGLGFLLLASLWSCVHAEGRTGDAPDIGAWYAGLKQPDNGTSCCGDGDAYYADKTEECNAKEIAADNECAFVAIITDTRPDEFYVPDDNAPNGKRLVKRAHLNIGTRISIPKRKLRHPPIANPTDHNVVFVNANEYGNSTICWEPVAGL